MSRPFQGASDLAHRLVDLPDSGAPFIPLKDPSCLRITKVAQVLSACHSEEVQVQLGYQQDKDCCGQ